MAIAALPTFDIECVPTQFCRFFALRGDLCPAIRFPFTRNSLRDFPLILACLVREDVAFANHKGVEKSGIRKRTEQALEKLQEPLRKFLEPDEAVFYVARAQIMPSGVEQFFLGWHAMFLAPAVLVLTNRRLLHLLVERNGTWKRSLRCALWGDMEEAKVKGFLGARLHIKYRDGRKEIYSAIAGNDAKKIQLLLETLIPA